MKDFSGDIKFFTEQEKYYAALGFEHLAENFKRASVSLSEATQIAQELAAALQKYEEEEN